MSEVYEPLPDLPHLPTREVPWAGIRVRLSRFSGLVGVPLTTGSVLLLIGMHLYAWKLGLPFGRSPDAGPPWDNLYLRIASDAALRVSFGAVIAGLVSVAVRPSTRGAVAVGAGFFLVLVHLGIYLEMMD